MKTINVLGTEYKLITDAKREDYPQLHLHTDGYCNYAAKEIVVTQDDSDETAAFDYYIKGVIRHEIVHAYFYESGLHDYADDETLVDWVALQLPKMSETFKEIDV